MTDSLIKELKTKMEAAINALRKEFTTVRTGRANLSMLDGVVVEYYGNPTPLNQVATLSVPEPRTITISPWEAKIIKDIEKAIQKSELGLTPTDDGKVIRITIPALTEERRKELVKVLKRMAEDGKIAIRNIRRDGMDALKAKEKNKEISEDDHKKLSGEVQHLTDSFISEIDKLTQHKEKEIMEV